MRHVLKSMEEDILCKLGIGMTNIARIIYDISVRKKEVGTYYLGYLAISTAGVQQCWVANNLMFNNYLNSVFAC